MNYYLKPYKLDGDRASGPVEKYVDFIHEMSAWQVDAEQIANYTDSLRMALEVAKLTGESQLVAGEQKTFLVVHPNGNVVKCEEGTVYTLLTDETIFDFSNRLLYGSFEIDLYGPDKRAAYSFDDNSLGRAFEKCEELLASKEYSNVRLWRLTEDGRREIRSFRMKELAGEHVIREEVGDCTVIADENSFNAGVTSVLSGINKLCREGMSVEEAYLTVRRASIPMMMGNKLGGE